MSSLDYLDLCRLCLVKDRVSVPIFEGEGDVRQIFLKIAACLPVKVTREDKLPKKICDDCVYKVELLYQFWNTTANAEKQLLQWLGEVGLEDKQSYVTGVLNPNVMKQEQNGENRLDGNAMQQVNAHQPNMGMGMMDNMGMGMPLMMSTASQQQMTSVPMDTSGNPVQSVQAVPGPSTQTTHDQMAQNQANAPPHQDEEEESSEEEENSDDDCDGDEGLPVKEESEEDPSNSRTLEPTTFVNVSLACDEPGPSGLQQQKIAEMPEMSMPQVADGDPKSGSSPRDPLGGIGTMVLEYQPDVIVDFECKSEYVDWPIKEEPSPVESKRITPRIESFETLRSCAEIDNFEKSKKRTGLLECDYCGKRCWKKSMLIKHMKQHKYVCEECRENFRLVRNLRRHMREAHGRLWFHCNVCDYKCIRKGSLNNHFVRQHTSSFKFHCIICDKQFKVRNSLKQHMKYIHSGNPPIVCSLCGHVSNNEPAMKTHMRRRHYKSPYKCSVCKCCMANEENLEQHMLRHEKDQKITCPTCGKTFEAKRSLNFHLRIHHGSIKPFACPVCDSTFSWPSRLEQHILIHTGKRVYKCDICARTFVQHSTLLCHRRKHPGPLPNFPTVSVKNIVAEFMKEHAMKSEVVTVKTESSG